MKNSLREAANENCDQLDVEVGQYVFFKQSKIFGKISSITECVITIAWESSNSIIMRSYRWHYMRELGRQLLDGCVLCENESDKLFLILKYGLNK